MISLKRDKMTFLDESELEKTYYIDSAPVLIVFNQDNELRYLGGYFKRSAAITPYDTEIFWKVVKNQKVNPLPLYGCAVSKKLQEIFDPLGIKY